MTIVFGTEEFESHVLCLYNVKSCLLTIAKKDDYRSKFTSPDNIYGVFLPKHSDLEIDKMHEGYIKVYVIEFLNSSDKVILPFGKFLLNGVGADFEMDFSMDRRIIMNKRKISKFWMLVLYKSFSMNPNGPDGGKFKDLGIDLDGDVFYAVNRFTGKHVKIVCNIIDNKFIII